MRSVFGMALASALALTAGAAEATIVTVFDTTVSNGVTNFNNTVTGAGGTATADQWSTFGSGASVDRGAYTVTRTNGNNLSSTTYGSISGRVVSIGPYGGPGIGSIQSGLTFTFDDPVNAIGFEVADWGTCCQPSALYISFDDGAPILVGVSNDYGDVFGPNGPEVFVAAFNDAGSFTKVQFWGDGDGEVLYMGGTIRYALLDGGSLPPPTGVPEPATLALLGAALIGVGVIRRRRASA